MRTLLHVFLVLAVSFLIFAFWRRQKFVERLTTDEKTLVELAQTHPPSSSTAVKLPRLLQQYHQLALPEPLPTARLVSLQQSGVMIQTPGGSELPFTAHQLMTVQTQEFSWIARFSMAGIFKLLICDRLIGNEGWLEGRLWGAFPIAHAEGPAVLKGQLLRYLAEFPWNPLSLFYLPQAHWREVGPHELALTLTSATTPIELFISLNAEGLPVRIRANDRPRDLGGGRSVPTPWEGTFSDYERRAGLLVPTKAEVSWILPEGRFTYFRAQLTQYELL